MITRWGLAGPSTVQDWLATEAVTIFLSSCKVVFLHGCLLLRSSSCDVLFLWVCLSVRFQSLLTPQCYFLFFPFLAKYFGSPLRGKKGKNYKKKHFCPIFLPFGGNLEHFSFFPFVARFFEPQLWGGGIKHFKNGFFQFSAILVNLEHFSFFPFVARFFGHPLWGGGRGGQTFQKCFFLPFWSILNTFYFFRF